MRPGSQSGNHHHGPWQLFTLSFFIFYAQLCLGPSVLVLVFWHFVEAWCSATSTTMMTVAGALGCLGGEGLAFVEYCSLTHCLHGCSSWALTATFTHMIHMIKWQQIFHITDQLPSTSSFQLSIVTCFMDASIHRPQSD